MFPPCVEDIGLQRTTGWTVIVETSSTTINFEGRCVEHAPTQHGIQHLPVKGLTFQSCRRHDWVLRLFEFGRDVFVVRCGSCEAAEKKKKRAWWGVLFTSTERACDANERVHSLDGVYVK